MSQILVAAPLACLSWHALPLVVLNSCNSYSGSRRARVFRALVGVMVVKGRPRVRNAPLRRGSPGHPGSDGNFVMEIPANAVNSWERASGRVSNKPACCVSMVSACVFQWFLT